jgi:hypothetical protein
MTTIDKLATVGNDAHDLIMAVYQTRQAKEAARLHRKETLENEWIRERDIWYEKHRNIDADYGHAFLEPPEGLQYDTPASKEAHAAYTTASHRAGAAMRALMKYGKEHEA